MALVSVPCTAAEACEHTGLEDRCEGQNGAQKNVSSNMEEEPDKKSVANASDGGTAFLPCAVLQTEKEVLSSDSFSTDHSRLLPRCGPALGTPVCGSRPPTTHSGESPTYLRPENTLPKATSYIRETRLKATQTAAAAEGATEDGIPSSVANIPLQALVAQHGSVSDLIASNLALRFACSEGQMQGRNTSSEQLIQDVQRKDQGTLHKWLSEVFCADLDGSPAISEEHLHARDLRLALSLLLDSTTTNTQQSTGVSLAAPPAPSKEAAAGTGVLGVPMLSQRDALSPPTEYLHISCAPPEMSEKNTVKPSMYLPPAAASFAPPPCHPSCKQIVASQSVGSKRPCERHGVDTVSAHPESVHIETRSPIVEDTRLPVTSLPMVFTSVIPESEQSCSGGKFQTVLEEVSRYGKASAQMVSMKREVAHSLQKVVPDAHARFSSFGTEVALEAGSSTRIIPNRLLHCRVVCSRSSSAAPCDVKQVQSPSVLSETVCEDATPDFAPRTSAPRVEAVLGAERFLSSSSSSVASGAQASEEYVSAEGSCASTGNRDVIGPYDASSTWRREGHSGQSPTGDAIGLSRSAPTQPVHIASPVGGHSAARKDVSDTEVSQTRGVAHALGSGVLMLRPQRQSVVHSSGINSRDPWDSAGHMPRSESGVQPEEPAMVEPSEAFCTRTAGLQPAPKQLIPPVLRTLSFREGSHLSGEYAGVRDHSSAARVMLAALSMLELFAFLPAAQEESTGRPPDRAAAEAPPDEVNTPVANKHRSTDESMESSSREIRMFRPKFSSLFKAPFELSSCANIERASPGSVEQPDGTREVTCKQPASASAATLHENNCNALYGMTFDASECSTALVTSDNACATRLPAVSTDFAVQVQLHQPDSTTNCEAMQISSAPADGHLSASSCTAPLSDRPVPSTEGGDLEKREDGYSCSVEGAPARHPGSTVADVSTVQLQQFAQENLPMLTLHMLSNTGKSSKGVFGEINETSRNAQPCPSIGSPSPTPPRAGEQCFRGDARWPHETPDVYDVTRVCLDHPGPPGAYGQGSPAWPEPLSHYDRTAHTGVAAFGGGSQLEKVVACCGRAECSCVAATCYDRAAQISVTRADSRGALGCLQRERRSCPTREGLRRWDAAGSGHGVALGKSAAHIVEGGVASLADQQPRLFPCVHNEIQMLASGVVRSDLLPHVVNTHAGFPSPMQPIPCLRRQPSANCHTGRQVAEELPLIDHGNNTGTALHPSVLPLFGEAPNNVTGKDTQAFARALYPLEDGTRQQRPCLQLQQRQRHDELKAQHLLQYESKITQHRGKGALLLTKEVSSDQCVERTSLQKPRLTPDREDAAPFAGRVHKPQQSFEESTRTPDVAPKTADSSRLESGIHLAHTCPRAFVSYHHRGSRSSPSYKCDALLSRKQRHVESESHTCNDFKRPRGNQVRAASSFRGVLANIYTSTGRPENQASRHPEFPPLPPNSVSSHASCSTARSPSSELALPHAQATGFTSISSKIPPPPPPPPPPPSPLSHAVAHRSSKMGPDYRSLSSNNTGTSPPTALTSLVDRAREISWLQTLHGTLEQQARRGGGSAYEAIAAALAVADASLQGPNVPGSSSLPQQHRPAIALEIEQLLPSSTAMRYANNDSSSTGDIGAPTLTPTSDTKRPQLLSRVEHPPGLPAEGLAEAARRSMCYAADERWTASFLEPAHPISPSRSSARQGPVLQMLSIAEDASPRLPKSNVSDWRKTDAAGEASVDPATKGGNIQLPRREYSTEGGDGSTYGHGGLTKRDMKHAHAAEDSSTEGRRQVDDRTSGSSHAEITRCALTSAAAVQPLQGNNSEEGTQMQAAPLFPDISSNQQRVGSAEVSQARRRQPRPSKRQRVLIRALAYVKQRLKKLESGTFPLGTLETPALTTARPEDENWYSSHPSG